MIIRRQTTSLRLLTSFLLLSFCSSTLAEDNPFDCHLTVNALTFDLTQLGGLQHVERTRDTPPSSMLDSVRFDLCADLKPQEGVVERDQCPSGTRACLTTTNKKADEPDRIVAVIPIAQTSSLKPTYSNISSPKGLSLILHGSEYPHPSDPTLVPQTMNLTLLCNSQETSEPKFISYDGAQLQIEWSTPAGCSVGTDDGKTGDETGDNGEEGNGGGNDDGSEKSVGSGIGWFFLVLLLAFAAYFGLGAYYNYSTYGASGRDLIPHRDFWKEVPYMLSDVVSHLCSSVRPRRTSSRGGYISV